MFGFLFVSAEDLILQKLPQKVADHSAEPISGTHEIAEFLNQNPHHLTLEWVLEIVSEELVKHPGRPALVDMIPNLKFLMQAKSFIKNCEKEMIAFEEKVSLAWKGENWFASFCVGNKIIWQILTANTESFI